MVFNFMEYFFVCWKKVVVFFFFFWWRNIWLVCKKLFVYFKKIIFVEFGYCIFLLFLERCCFSLFLVLFKGGMLFWGIGWDNNIVNIILCLVIKFLILYVFFSILFWWKVLEFVIFKYVLDNWLINDIWYIVLMFFMVFWK